MLSPEVMIANLRQKLAMLPPGDGRRLDVCGLILIIEDEMLGGNHGHAQMLVTDMVTRASVFARTEERYDRVMSFEV